MVDINSVIQSAVKSGKAFYGINQSVKAVEAGKIAALVLADNCPSESRKILEGYAAQSSVPVLNYTDTNHELGIACHKPFSISAMVIREIAETELGLEVKELTKKTNES
jgi:large subunit ribosomal protein L30e